MAAVATANGGIMDRSAPSRGWTTGRLGPLNLTRQPVGVPDEALVGALALARLPVAAEGP